MAKHIFRILILIFVLSPLAGTAHAADASICNTLLAGASPEIQASIHELAKLRYDLDQRAIRGLDDVVTRTLSAEFNKKQVEILAVTKLDQKALAVVIAKEIRKIQGHSESDAQSLSVALEEEAQVIKESVIDGNRIVIYPIQPGIFQMGEVGMQREVEITEPFEMSAILTTQIVWKKIAEKAEQKFPGKFQLNPDPSKFKGDLHPVEQVSYEEVKTWISALNDLSKAGEPGIGEWISGHKAGDVYRLPTDAEWEFVVRGRGQDNDAYSFGSDESQLEEYAWFTKNSDNQTHPVAQKYPQIVNGYDFYDMHGNVWEWVDQGTLRGGSFEGKPRGIRSGSRASASSDRSSGYGFRLVRSAR